MTNAALCVSTTEETKAPTLTREERLCKAFELSFTDQKTREIVAKHIANQSITKHELQLMVHDYIIEGDAHVIIFLEMVKGHLDTFEGHLTGVSNVYGELYLAKTGKYLRSLSLSHIAKKIHALPAEFPQLESLCITGNCFTAQAWKDLFTRAKQCKRLCLDNTVLDSTLLQCIFSYGKQLEEITFSSCTWKGESTGMQAPIAFQSLCFFQCEEPAQLLTYVLPYTKSIGTLSIDSCDALTKVSPPEGLTVDTLRLGNTHCDIKTLVQLFTFTKAVSFVEAGKEEKTLYAI